MIRWLMLCLSLALPASLAAQRMEGAYRLQPEDLIRVFVVGEPELSVPQALISRDGKVSVPIIGEIHAAGLTTTELEQLIARRFRELDILREPRISVGILQFHRPRVSVLGFVLRPGTFEFKEGDRISDALALGGGPNYERARLEEAWLQRADGTKIQLNLYRLLFEGDTSYTWRPGLTVLDALSQAAWETERARLSQTFVVRQKPDGTEERIRVDLVRLLNKGDMKQNIELQPGDVVFVSETNTPNFDQIYRILSVAWILRQLDYGRSIWRP
jgi:polysaccharide export outer membrane protein